MGARNRVGIGLSYGPAELHRLAADSLELILGRLKRIQIRANGTLSKKVIVFPVLSRDVTNRTIPGRELLNYSRPGRVWLVKTRLLSYTVKKVIVFPVLSRDVTNRTLPPGNY
jgi:hypothetical protein